MSSDATLGVATADRGRGSTTYGDGRYRVARVLAAGSRTETLVAEDTLTGEPVVIKTLVAEQVTPVVEALLEHEAHVLAQLTSPWVAPLREVGREDGRLYLVTPYIEGVTLAARIADRALPVREAIAVGLELFAALRDVHDLGVVHRDVKPSNIMLSAPGDGSPVATLIDFGFSWSARLDIPARDQAAGTVRYMAPETAGLIDVPVDERADLYSAGVTLHEIVAGAPPFAGRSVGEVLRAHLTEPPPSLRHRGIAVPRAFDAILQRLLRKDPHERYATAEAVRADLAHLAEALDAGDRDPAIVVGFAERRTTLAAPAFVGRRSELEVLRGQLGRTQSGAAGLTLLEAPSGGGKSRLLDEFTTDAAQAEALVLRGQALDQAAPRPLQVLSGLADGLLEANGRDPRVGRMLLDNVGEHAAGIVDALPPLAAILGHSGEHLGPEEHGEQRNVQALVRLLDALGRLAVPTVVVLDDCQWADQLTLKVLRAWWQTAPRRERQLLLVAAFRSDEVAAQHPLRRIGTDDRIELAPLDDEDLCALTESMAGRLPGEAQDTILRLADGSPFMAGAMLRGMVESRALVRTADAWEIVPEAMAELSSSRHAAAVLAQRLRLLSERTSELLGIGAVLGKQFDLTLLHDLSGVPLGEIVTGLREAQQRHIVWLHADRSHASFAHDKLRETVLAGMDPRERRRWHLRAAARLEEVDGARVFELAYHFDAADEPGRALPYAIEAAARARGQHALEIAAQQYRIAERGVPDDDVATRHDIAVGVGEVALLQGRYDAAEEALNLARSLTHDPKRLATVGGLLGSLAFKRGDSTAAAERIEAALRSLGRRVPKRRSTYLACLLWEVAVQLTHTVAPRWLLARRSLKGADGDLLAARLYSRLAHAYWFDRGSIPTAWAHLREMNLAERYPPTPELAQAYSEHAPVMTLLTYFERGIRYVQRSLDIRRDLGDVWGQGQSQHFYGLVLYGASRYREAIESCDRAIRLLERTGDLWEINTARWHVAYAHYRLGDLSTAVELARQVHRSGSQIGDTQARGISLSVWSKATDGLVPAELLEPEIARISTDVHTGAEVLQAEAVRLLYDQRPDEAEQVLLRARRMVVRTLAFQEYVAPLFTWLVEVRRRQVERSSAWAPRRRRRLRRRAVRAAWWARRVAYRYRNNLPHALRESGLTAAMAGHPRRARRWLRQSLAVAVEHEALAEQAQTRIALGEVGLALGWPDAEDLSREGRRSLAVLRAEPDGEGFHLDPVTPSLVARFDAILEQGRRVAAALTLPEIYAAVHDAALTLLRGETCVVLERHAEEGGWHVVHGALDAPWSTALLEAAVERGQPVRAHDQEPDSSSQSLLLNEIRSGLCTPLYSRGRGDACFVVANHHVSALYGEEEEALAGFIATIAGAAIENAHGFEEIRGLTRSLESKVEERTTALGQALERERELRAESDRRAALLDLLAAAGRRMSTLDPDQVLQTVIDTALESGFEGAEVCVLDGEEGRYRVSHCDGLPADYRRDARPVAGVVGQVVRHRRLTVVPDYGELPDADPTIRAAGLRLAVGTPIISHGDLLGVLVASRRTAIEPSKDELEAFELLAAQAGRALENARTFEEQRLTVERLGEVDRLKDEFLSTASHELRTPLTVIGGMVTTLEERWDELAADGQARHFLRRINANADALTQIVTTLLDFSQLQQKRLPVTMQAVDLAEVLEHSADRLQSLFDDHVFRHETEAGLLVHADPLLMHRVIENLLSNAAKYTPAGSTVTLRGVREGDHVVVSATDDGPGIAPEDLERLTERFFRGEQATLRPTRGLGLGLAFSAELLRLHGTVLEVASTPGNGACFSFRLEALTHDDRTDGAG